ncbi:Acetylornithine deacetylase/Succinyl-diaminopimelate desuccinylase [Congregibacter litoralis KT71]|uniref:Acetylornithine deacetylase/Succinyl-diaminopimelate desuccinylase n=2 Tax=Congregibacter TaxID=393661 RepID=A4A3I4_9GAMM|nr:Acetylornithine deacetylase/Succinyl-diaminopimelate desuccinylase [Congregibacter litoralis KT71]
MLKRLKNTALLLTATSLPFTLFSSQLPAATAADTAGALKAAVNQHIADHGGEILGDFRELLAMPNVSTSLPDMQKNAQWISRYIGERGFSSRIVRAGGAPYILAERKTPGATRTVLIYAHFDGQPVEPADWKTPPFEPTLKDAAATLDWEKALKQGIDPEWRVYARSAGDDKAPVIALMHAIDAMDAAGLEASVNVKLILDGEEEFGSPTVEQILEEHADELSADILLFCDGPMHQSGLRQLVFGVRGDIGVNLTLYGPSRPLHSGHYGNWAPHPTDALMRLLATMKDMDGNIQVAGYLDEVTPVSEAEQVAIAAIPSVDAQLQDELALGRVEGAGERIEMTIMRPAINIVGFQAGGVDDQARNIILSKARASLDLRLVPAQTIDHVKQTLEEHFKSQGFYVTYEEPSEEVLRNNPGVIKVDWTEGYPAYRSDLNGEAARKLTAILTKYDGEKPLISPTLGGSLPIHLFDQALDMPIVLLPIANHDNNQHGRDENMRVGNLFSAIGVYAAVLEGFGRN